MFLQEDFLRLVNKETILVGHSLENDLLALKINHDLVIDTAILYRHPRGQSYKTALRVLTRKFLSRVIQDSGKGHDSAEDARATMELALLKIKHGLLFICLVYITSYNEFYLFLACLFGIRSWFRLAPSAYAEKTPDSIK